MWESHSRLPGERSAARFPAVKPNPTVHKVTPSPRRTRVVLLSAMAAESQSLETQGAF